MTVFDDIFADYDGAGNPKKPVKSEIRSALNDLLLSQSGIVGFNAVGDMTLGFNAGTIARVYTGSATERGEYLKSGSSGSGSWTRTGDLPADAASKASGGLARAAVNDSAPVGRNLFDPARALGDYALLGTNGVVYGLADYMVTNFIPVRPGDILRVSATAVSYSFYTFEQLFVSGTVSGSVTPGTGITVPDGAYYFRMHTAKALLSSFVAVVNASLPIGYEPFAGNLSSVEVLQAREVAAQTQPLLRNLFDKNRRTSGYALQPTTGILYAAAGYMTTDFMPVTPGQQIVCNWVNNSYAFYNLGKTYLSGSAAGVAPGTTITVPAGAFFYKMQGGDTWSDSLMVLQWPTLPGGYIPFGGTTSDVDALKPYRGLTWAAAGDSISFAGVYQPLVAAATGLSWTRFTNDAVSGRQLHELVPELTYANLSSLYLLTIFCATNSFGYSRPLGRYGDAIGAGTFYGDVRGAVEACLTANPAMRLMFFTALQRGAIGGQPASDVPNLDGHVLFDYNDAIIKVCADYAVPVLDLGRMSGITQSNLTTWTADLLHPNSYGHARIAKQMSAFINSEGSMGTTDTPTYLSSLDRTDLIINGNGQINQEGATSQADDTYGGPDRWYALTQSNAILMDTYAGGPDGLSKMLQLTQLNASAQRMGAAQIIESQRCINKRGKALSLGGYLQCSSSVAIRYAVLGWTGTEDAVTSDVVNSWTNAAFTAGQFFNSTTLSVLAVGTVTPVAGAVTPYLLNIPANSSFTNLIVMMWTEGAVAQSTVLRATMSLKEGLTVRPRVFRSREDELRLCRRFCRVFDINDNAYGIGTFYTSTSVIAFLKFEEEMRAAPAAVSVSSPAHFQVVSNGAAFTPSAIALDNAGKNEATINATVSGGTAGQSGWLRNQSSSAKLVFRSEL